MKNFFKFLVLNIAMLSQVHFAYAQSTTASILPPAKTTFLDNNGKPLSKGTVDFYIPGTTTRKLTWQDAGETIPNTNPVVLDSSGRGIILGDGSYRQVVKDKNGNIIWDQITSSTGSGGGGSTPTVGDGDAVGTIKAWAGFTAPYGYVFSYGQELIRTSYPEVFAAITSQQNVSCTSGSPTLTGVSATTQLPIGAPIESSCLNSGATIVSKTTSTVTASSNATISTTTVATFFPFGNGDGNLTFNLPDLRGRVIAGNDIMGGIAANRLTSTYFGTSADALGANGGSQSQTLVTANLPPYAPAGTITNGAITTSIGNASGHTVQGIDPANSGSFTVNGGNFAYGQIAPWLTASSTQGTSTFTGANQGGTSTPVATIQPTQTSNYIIKIIPDSNPNSFFGVASIGGMYGIIQCGTGITCAGNIISSDGYASFTQGSVPFASATGQLTQNNNKLFYDNANNVLGIGNNIPFSSNQNSPGLSVSSSVGGLLAITNYNSSPSGAAVSDFTLALPTIQAHRQLLANNGSPYLLDNGINLSAGSFYSYAHYTWLTLSSVPLMQLDGSTGLFKLTNTASPTSSTIAESATQFQMIDGDSSTPHTSNTPTASIFRNDAIVGNGDLTGNAPALWVEVNANNTGTGNPNSASIIGKITQGGLGDIVGVTGLATMNSSNGNTAFGAFFDAEIDCTSCFSFAIETHNGNNSGINLPIIPGTIPSVVGLHVGAGGNNTNTAAMWISYATGGDTAAWDVGTYLSANSVLTASILDYSSAVTSLSIHGSHTNNIDMSGSTCTANQIKGVSSNFLLDCSGNLSSPSLSLFGSSGGSTKLQSSSTASGTLTLPAATDTLVGRATADTLTNKTISGASNTITNISLTTNVTGNLPVTNLNSGISASSTTFWRGDGTWATPSGSGNVSGPGSSVSGNVPSFNGTSGTVIQDSGIPSAALPTAIGQLPGVTTNSNASTGNVGEFPNNNSGTTALTTAIPTNAGQISLSPGDWDVSYSADFTGGSGTTLNAINCSISTVSATANLTTGSWSQVVGYGGTLSTGVATCAVPQVRLSLNTTTIVYGVVTGYFGTSTLSSTGFIQARRRR